MNSNYNLLFYLADEHIALLLKKNAVQGCLEFLQELFSDCGWPTKVPKSFLQVCTFNYHLGSVLKVTYGDLAPFFRIGIARRGKGL